MARKKNGPPWTPDAIASEARRYKVRGDFIRAAAGAYDAARRLGIVDKVCAHMTRATGGQKIWTEKAIRTAVRQCKTLKEFRTQFAQAYENALKDGLTDLLSKLKRTSHPMGYWTLERIRAEAQKYRYRSEFFEGSQGAYQAASRRGWLDRVCSHMELKRKPSGYWTKPRVLAAAKKYKARSEFMKGASSAYALATRGGYLDQACAHMERKGSQYERGVYAIEFADRSVYVGLTFDYDTRFNEHRTQNKRIGRKLEQTKHKFIRFNEWLPLDEAGKAEAHTIEKYRSEGWVILNRAKAGGVGSRPRKWSREEIATLAKRYKTVKAFQKAQGSAYVTACKRGWWKKISKHMKRITVHGKWTLEAVRKEAKKYKTRKAFADGSPGAHGRAQKSGWLDDVCVHMTKKRQHWTKDEVAEEAKKYSTRVAFSENSGGAYQAAFRQGWLDEICTHMVEIKKPTGYWTFDRCAVEATKYSTPSAFIEGSSSAYQRAAKNGWLEKICTHMEREAKPRGYWTKKRILERVALCKTLKEFRETQPAAYDAAYQAGYLPLLHKKLQMDKKPNGYWTLERVAAEAKTYQTRSEFQRGSSSAYSMARKKGWMERVCRHMPERQVSFGQKPTSPGQEHRSH